MHELENSDNESADNESEDDSSGSEDDFEGYLDESIDYKADESSDEEQNNEEDVEGVIPLISSYTLQPGVSVTIGGSRPLDFFSQFVNQPILQHIVEHTNLNAEQYMSSHTLAPRSRIRQWLKQDHTLSELHRFIALILVMGLVRYPKVESHWSTSWPYATEAFSSVSYRNSVTYTCMYKYMYMYIQVMKRDRFSLLLRFLHLNDNSQYKKKGEPGHDPLFKLRPFLAPLIANFQRVYTLNREVSVDESMIGFKGRLGFIQYMPKKPTKWGMKAYVLSDAHTGYIYSWHLYTGNTQHWCSNTT